MVRTQIFESEQAYAVPSLARLTLIGCMCLADDYGVFSANPKLVRSYVYSMDDTVSVDDVAAHLDWLEKASFVIRFTHEGSDYGFITGWDDKNSLTYQTVQWPSQKRNPEPPSLNEGSMRAHVDLNEGSLSPHIVSDKSKTKSQVPSSKTRKEKVTSATRSIRVKRKKNGKARAIQETPIGGVGIFQDPRAEAFLRTLDPGDRQIARDNPENSFLRTQFELWKSPQSRWEQ